MSDSVFDDYFGDNEEKKQEVFSEGDEEALNPNTRVPVCLCLDISSSMSGAPIDELNKGVQEFYKAINDDDDAKDSAEVCIVTFNSSTQVLEPFSSIKGNFTPPTLYASGMTAMGAGVELALNELEKRKAYYKSNGIDYYQPFMVLMTDGEPTDYINQATQKTCDLEAQKKLTILPIGIGGANMQILGQFSQLRQPMKLHGLDFKAFFQWLSKSVSVVSSSTAGNAVNLPNPSGWGSVVP
ncbi:vWA domain-containing protein [Helicobacter cetorum]|uniref:von Willebrand factor type A domain-containing protein n=1 Tax=Helicobacter cetorum (strain ATCC BAA-429 / MIT 00-7128) TaxID=182217 RepID=I0ENW1_HELC0|nr:VWA domain-containing protein [Helicobacter cetorum]AFI04630.1 von Willebrand factor type A domain-containing protein [Helicobacter cetorum MIT 00-7128]